MIPAPKQLRVERGSYELVDGRTAIVVDSGDAEALWVARYLVDLVERTRGLRLRVLESGEGIRLVRLEKEALGREAYRVTVTPVGASIEAGHTPGLFYGATTLWQLMASRARRGTALVPAVRIDDEPRFSWRGLMLDSARHYQSPAFIRRLVDVMALHRLNVLHWHLTDDQAWRLEIKKYPRLTEVGAWRVPAGDGPAADIDPATGRLRLYGGYYTQDDVRALVAYAADRNVTIVPEIEMPGHATAAIVAYPALGSSSKTPDAVPADWGIYPNLFNVEEETFAFLEDVLVEVMDLFPSRYIHLGGDEAIKTQWRASARVKARMKELDVADEEALQSYFMRRMAQFLSKHGRRLIGWDEILAGDLPPHAAVMSWRGVDGAIAAARRGHGTVLAAWPLLYFDNRVSDSPNEPPGRGRVVSVRDVYEFEVRPAGIPNAALDRVLGVQANVWTEHIRTEDRVWRMAFPRAAAVAELGWSAPRHIRWDGFAARLKAQASRYHSLGLPPPPAPAPSPQTHRRQSRELETCDDKLVLALEDDAPVDGPRAVFLIDIMRPCWVWRDVDLTGTESIMAAVGQVPFNFQIGDDIKKISLRPPSTPEGELEVRLGCDGERVAVLPLAPAASNPATTVLPPVALETAAARGDLCFTFTARGVDPMYAIDWVALEGSADDS